MDVDGAASLQAVQVTQIETRKRKASHHASRMHCQLFAISSQCGCHKHQVWTYRTHNMCNMSQLVCAGRQVVSSVLDSGKGRLDHASSLDEVLEMLTST